MTVMPDLVYGTSHLCLFLPAADVNQNHLGAEIISLCEFLECLEQLDLLLKYLLRKLFLYSLITNNCHGFWNNQLVQ